MSGDLTYEELKKRVQELEQVESKLTTEKEALRKSQQIIEGILSSIPVRVFWKDQNLVYLGCNALFANDAGFTDSKGLPLRSSTGRIDGVLGTYMDITDRKRADEALKTSQQSLSQIIDFLPDPTFVIDNEGKVVAWNHAIEQMTGITAESILGKGDYEYSIPFYGVRRPILIDLVRKWNNETEKTYEYVKKEGESFVSETYDCLVKPAGTLWNKASLLYDKDGKVTGAIESIRDISDHKIIEKRLRSQKAYFKGLVDNMPDAIALFDDDGIITEINPQFTRMFGYSDGEAVGQNISELVGPNDRLEEAHSFRRRIVSGEIIDVETVRKSKDGAMIDISLRSTPVIVDNNRIGHLVIYRDISPRKQAENEKARLEAQLQQSQRMEAIGTLTGGIAHDYNNLMSIVMGNLSMAMEEAEPNSLQADYLSEANTASHKVRDLTHELMSLSRGGAPVKELGSLDELLKTALDIMPADSGISLNESVSQDLWQVPHDPYKMGAVFRNVVTNAVEAMPEGGALTITAENLRIEDKEQYPGLPVNPGDYVHISFQDQGVGIPEEHLDKIFDPYFSTKEMGVQKGMGLGLATAYAIVKSHRGHVAVDSTLGVGTTVNIYLPAQSQSVGADAAISMKDNSASPIKRVLVMDDEESLRNLSQKILERLGHKVDTVKDGVEAIETYKKNMVSGEPFDAVILDLTIKGGMGGEQTMRELLKIDPDVKAIVSSGYFNDPVMSDFEKYGFMGALAKPYEKGALKEMLKRLSE